MVCFVLINGLIKYLCGSIINFNSMKKIILVLMFALIGLSVNAQFIQQGNKLVGTGAINGTLGDNQGSSVSISSDGNTAIVGGSDDNNIGAAWVYIRTSGIWSQQGSKLVGSGSIGNPSQGWSVSISSDGNTALVGGHGDSNGVGATWVFTRTAGVWSQQGNKLIGTGAVGFANQGTSVSLSSDGNTAIIGGLYDNNNVGAAWVFTRSAGIWTQQGNKLVGTGAVGSSWQGYKVSISADGNTAIIGGSRDNNNTGAAWVFIRTGGVWTQQGSKLVGTGAIGAAYQGNTVSISPDGNTAIIGGPNDNNNIGAAWVFTRSAGVWTQQGNKLVGTGATGNSMQGNVSLSYSGDTAVIGGSSDNNSLGAVWVYTRTSGVWSQQGTKLVGTGAAGVSQQGNSICISSDGYTFIEGGNGDNNFIGAAWIFSSGTSGIEEINKGNDKVIVA